MIAFLLDSYYSSSLNNLFSLLLAKVMVFPVYADTKYCEKPTIIYNEEEKGFYIKGSTIEEVFQQFDESPYFEEDLESNQKDLVKIRNVNSRSSTVNKNYYLTKNVVGVNGIPLKIRWGITVQVKKIKFNGTNYDMFVKVVDKVTSISGVPYKISSSGKLNTSILNGGATLEVSQFLQFETTTSYSSNVSIGPSFYKHGSSVGGKYYYRTNLLKYTSRHNLPLLNIVQ